MPSAQIKNPHSPTAIAPNDQPNTPSLNPCTLPDTTINSHISPTHVHSRSQLSHHPHRQLHHHMKFDNIQSHSDLNTPTTTTPAHMKIVESPVKNQTHSHSHSSYEYPPPMHDNLGIPGRNNHSTLVNSAYNYPPYYYDPAVNATRHHLPVNACEYQERIPLPPPYLIPDQPASYSYLPPHFRPHGQYYARPTYTPYAVPSCSYDPQAYHIQSPRPSPRTSTSQNTQHNANRAFSPTSTYRPLHISGHSGHSTYPYAPLPQQQQSSSAHKHHKVYSSTPSPSFSKYHAPLLPGLPFQRSQYIEDSECHNRATMMRYHTGKQIISDKPSSPNSRSYQSSNSLVEEDCTTTKESNTIAELRKDSTQFIHNQQPSLPPLSSLPHPPLLPSHLKVPPPPSLQYWYPMPYSRGVPHAYYGPPQPHPAYLPPPESGYYIDSLAHSEMYPHHYAPPHQLQYPIYSLAYPTDNCNHGIILPDDGRTVGKISNHIGTTPTRGPYSSYPQNINTPHESRIVTHPSTIPTHYDQPMLYAPHSFKYPVHSSYPIPQSHIQTCVAPLASIKRRSFDPSTSLPPLVSAIPNSAESYQCERSDGGHSDHSSSSTKPINGKNEAKNIGSDALLISQNPSITTEAGSSDRSRSSIVVLTKRKYRRHPRTDLHEPQKPPSAYMVFSNEVRTERKNSSLSFSDMAKIVGDRWKMMDPLEKKHREESASRSKAEYHLQMQRYKQTPLHNQYQAYLAEFEANAALSGRLYVKPRKR